MIRQEELAAIAVEADKKTLQKKEAKLMKNKDPNHAMFAKELTGKTALLSPTRRTKKQRVQSF